MTIKNVIMEKELQLWDFTANDSTNNSTKALINKISKDAIYDFVDSFEEKPRSFFHL